MSVGAGAFGIRDDGKTFDSLGKQFLTIEQEGQHKRTTP